MSAQYEDKEIACIDCPGGEKFVWTAREQEFFASRGFSAPKRCKTHAAAKRKAFADKEKRDNSAFNPKNIEGYHRGQSDAEMLAGTE